MECVHALENFNCQDCEKTFKSEKKMYESLWKIMFNVQIEDEDDNTVDELVSYIKNG